MRRREFILAGLLVAAGASALRAAETNRVYRLAACTQLRKAVFSNAVWTRFFDRLHQNGYAEGKNLIVDRYAADGQPERYAEVARNAVTSRPDVIVNAIGHELILHS